MSVPAASSHHSAILVEPDLFRSPASACDALGEKLLPVNLTFFQTDISLQLKYQVFLGNYPTNQMFLVASEGLICQAVDIHGGVHRVSCSAMLPGLCSQSAGVGAPAKHSTLIDVSSNGVTYTG